MKPEEKRIDDAIRGMIAQVDPRAAAALGIPLKANGHADPNGHLAPRSYPQNDDSESPPDCATATERERPRIRVNGRELQEVTTDALQALRSAGSPLYFRSGKLVRISPDEKGTPVIAPVGESELRGEMARSAVYMKVSAHEKDGQTIYIETEVSPPIDYVRDIRARDIAGMQADLKLPEEELPFPALTSVTESPVLRSDGTILTTPGYDKQSGVFYIQDPEAGVPNIPDDPITDEQIEARDLILETICDFPFANEASRANAFAFMLTPMLRRSITGHVPLAMIDSPQSGTGKSLLIDVMGFVATGRRPAMKSAPREEEEWSKTLCATLATGTTVCVFDNVDHKLNSSNLAMVLTAEEYESRRLGVNTENLRYPNLCSWAVTGNNLQLGGDLPRRCYEIRLDAKMSKPWKRSPEGFKHPELLAWATAEKTRIQSALLTIIRAWYAHGQPPNPKGTVLGGFESWSRTVGGILAYAGVEGFLQNLEEMYQTADEDGAQWEGLLEVLADIYGVDAPFTVADLCRRMDNDSTLRDAVPNAVDAAANPKKQGSFSRCIGRAFVRHVGTRFGDEGWYLERAGTASRAVRWVVKKQTNEIS